MKAVQIDPRDTTWEADFPAFRVYFWRGSMESIWASDEWRITEADVSEVLDWAASNADGRYLTIWVEAEDRGQLGMIRLQGWEPTRPDRPPGTRVQLAPDASKSR